jgi:plastocyanin
MRRMALLLAALSIATPAAAGDLTVMVTTPLGAPVKDAVVMVHSRSGAAHGPIHFSWPYVMNQKDMQFDPFVLIVPVGATVAFPNRDPFRHHVYSFSPAKTFELKLYGHDETRTVKFDKAGIVALGCNIHDNMTAFIRVVDTPYAAKTDAHGTAVIVDAPDGPASVEVWHPYIRGGRDLSRQTNIPARSVTMKITADVHAPPMRKGMY